MKHAEVTTTVWAVSLTDVKHDLSILPGGKMDGLRKKKKTKGKRKEGSRRSQPPILYNDVRGSVISFRPRSATDYELMHQLKTSDQMANIASGLINKRLLIQKHVNLSPQIVDEIFRALEEVAECDNSIVVHFIKEFHLLENSSQNTDDISPDDISLDVPVIKLLLDLLQFSLEPIEHNALWVKLLSVLSQADENIEVFVKMKVAATMMGAMAAHINHREIQENGCLLLSNIARFKPTPKQKAPVRESGIEVVTRAMEKHLDNKMLQRLGCRVIANVLNTMHSVSTWVVQQDYDEEDAEKLTISSLEVIDYTKDHVLPMMDKVTDLHKANLDIMKEVARVRVYFRNNDSEKTDCVSEKLCSDDDYSKKKDKSTTCRNGILKKYVSTGDIPNRVRRSITRRVTFSNSASVRLEILGSSSDEDDSNSDGSVENVKNYDNNKRVGDKLQHFMQGNLLAQRRELELANGLAFPAQMQTTGSDLTGKQEMSDFRQPINLDNHTSQSNAFVSSTSLTHLDEQPNGEELSAEKQSENPGSQVSSKEIGERSHATISQESVTEAAIRKSIGDAHNRPVPLVSLTFPGDSEKFIPSIHVIPADKINEEEFESSNEVNQEDYDGSEENWDDNDNAVNLCDLEKVEADDENNWVYIKESDEISQEDFIDTDEESDYKMGQAESYSRFYEDSQTTDAVKRYDSKVGGCLVRGNSKFYINNQLPDIEKEKGFECSASDSLNKKQSFCGDINEDDEIDIEMCEKFRADNAINEGKVEEIDFKMENIEDGQELTASAQPEGRNELRVKQVGRFIIIEDDLLDDPSEPRKGKKKKEKRRSFYDNVEYVSLEPSSESSEDEKNFSEKSETESQLAEEDNDLEEDNREEDDDDKNGKGMTDSTRSWLRREKCVILAVNEIEEDDEEKSFVYNSSKGKEIIDEYTEIDIVEALIRGKCMEKSEIKAPSPPSSPISDYSPTFTKLWKKASFRERYRDSEVYSDADLSEVATEDSISLSSSFENLIAQSLDEAFKDIGEASFDVDSFGDIEMKSKSLEMNLTAAVCRRLSSVSRPPAKPRRTMYYKNGDDVRMSLERTSHLDWSQQLMMHNRDPYEFEGLSVKRTVSIPDNTSGNTHFWEKSTEELDLPIADIQEETSMEVTAIMEGTEAVYDICTLWVNDRCVEAIETFDKLVKRVRANSMSSTKSLYFTDLHDSSKRVQRVTDTDIFGWSGILSVISSDEAKWTLSLSALVLPVTDRLFDICSISILDAAVELVQLLVKKYGKEVVKNHHKGVIRTKYREECRSCYIWFSKIRFRIEDMLWQEQERNSGTESDNLLHSSILHSVFEVLKPFDAKS